MPIDGQTNQQIKRSENRGFEGKFVDNIHLLIVKV